jgi:two-component system chemotaxis response regulator CheY
MNMKEGRQLKLLVVDDVKGMRDEFSAICREAFPFCRIDEAENVMRAMACMQKESPPYDAVFTDINMPEISGLQLIPLIRDLPAYKNTPLIVISTLAGRSDVDRAIQLGASGYLIRPLQKEDFEVVRLAYLDPIQIKKRKSAAPAAEDMVASLRKLLK